MVMEPREMVAALRDRDPDAVRVLYDTYGESLFQYCWLVLRSRDAAQAAVRDTLAAAREDIDQVGDPVRLRPWLYALARAECHGRGPVQLADAEPPAQPGQPYADRRDMAWDTVAGMSPDHAEILDLAARHGMEPREIALTLGVGEQQALELTEAAKSELRDCLGAQLVIRRGDPGCEGRAAALRGWTGSMTTAFRGRLLDHATGCEACGRHLPGAVSAARVYEYLPFVVPGPRRRAEMLDWLTGERPPAAAPAEAATPPDDHHEPLAANRTMTRMRVLVGAVVVIAAAAAAALILGWLPGHVGGHGPAVGRTGYGSPVTRSAPSMRTSEPASGR